MHVSTDYVFDGERKAPYAETDACAPLNAYGASKLAGEQLVARCGGRFLIVRTSGLYAFWRALFRRKACRSSRKFLRGAEGGEPLRVVNDK